MTTFKTWNDDDFRAYAMEAYNAGLEAKSEDEFRRSAGSICWVALAPNASEEVKEEARGLLAEISKRANMVAFLNLGHSLPEPISAVRTCGSEQDEHALNCPSCDETENFDPLPDGQLWCNECQSGFLA